MTTHLENKLYELGYKKIKICLDCDQTIFTKTLLNEYGSFRNETIVICTNNEITELSEYGQYVDRSHTIFALQEHVDDLQLTMDEFKKDMKELQEYLVKPDLV